MLALPVAAPFLPAARVPLACTCFTSEGPALGWPLVCAQDELVPATEANWQTLDFIWIHKPAPKTAAKQLFMLPFQGERYYHASAVARLIETRRISVKDLGMGLRASAW